jgi:hypothetical protein
MIVAFPRSSGEVVVMGQYNTVDREETTVTSHDRDPP